MRVVTVAVRAAWLAVVVGATAQARPFTLCTLGFQGPEEIAAVRAHLHEPDFRTVDLTAAAAAPADANAPSWLAGRCRADLRCDVVVVSGEFGGRFFGQADLSLGLQDLTEASCLPQCDGVFHAPQEVFLLACNTLATKDQDERSPEQYLQVLLDHEFDRGAAERVVQMRYGPIGPSFREALRTAFMGVPRLYGFSSVAPKGVYTAPMLARYFTSVGDYADHLDRDRDDTATNTALLRAFGGTALTQARGLDRSDPGAADRALVCGLYDRRRPVEERLDTAATLMRREDFLAFLPTLETFLDRHPSESLSDEERRRLRRLQDADGAHAEVMRLVRDLGPSSLRLEVAHFARHLDWLDADAFRRLATDDTRTLLKDTLTSELVDTLCAITKHQPIGAGITAADLPSLLYVLPEGIRLIDCIGSTDARVTQRLAPAVDSDDPATRIWATYALSRRLPLPADVLARVAAHVDDATPEVRERARWVVEAQRRAKR